MSMVLPYSQLGVDVEDGLLPGDLQYPLLLIGGQLKML